jgi:hypothetical protein
MAEHDTGDPQRSPTPRALRCALAALAAAGLLAAANAGSSQAQATSPVSEIRLPGPLEAIASDGTTLGVFFNTDRAFPTGCGVAAELAVPSGALHELAGSHATACAAQHLAGGSPFGGRSLAVSEGRMAWIAGSYGNCSYAFAQATGAHAPLPDGTSCGAPDDRDVGPLAGGAGVIAFDQFGYDQGDTTDCALHPLGGTGCIATSNERLDLLAADGTLHTIATGPSGLVVAAVSRDGFLLRGADGTIAWLDPGGSERWRVTPAAPAIAAALDGDLVVDLAGRRTLEVRDAATGKLRASWPLGVDAGYSLAAAGGVAAYVAGSSVHVVSLPDGADRDLIDLPASATLVDVAGVHGGVAVGIDACRRGLVDWIPASAVLAAAPLATPDCAAPGMTPPLAPIGGLFSVTSGRRLAGLPPLLGDDQRPGLSSAVGDGDRGWFLAGVLRAGDVPCGGLAHVDGHGRVDARWCRTAVDPTYASLARSGRTLVLTTPDGVAAWDIASARRLRWPPLPARLGYPQAPIEPCGDVIVTVTSHALVGLDARSGRVRWSRPASKTAQQRLLGAGGGQAFVETTPYDDVQHTSVGDVSCESGRRGHVHVAATGIGAVGEGRLVLAGALDGQGRGGTKVFVIDAPTGRIQSTTPLHLQGDAAAPTSIVIRAGRVFVGGRFDHAASFPRAGLAALSLATGAVLPWHVAPWTFGTPFPLASDGQRLLLGTQGLASALYH